MSKKGFTLVEILIVVFIIGLLSSIVLVGLGSFRARGRDARRIADLHSMQNALELYFSKAGIYPDMTANSASEWGVLASSLKSAGIGVANVPSDPAAPAGKFYRYSPSPDGLSYVLAAILEDSSNPVLREDVDGSVYSISCDDTVTEANYCIQF
jgi:general secretion pathway protein G